jgi:hypothetical protein
MRTLFVGALAATLVGCSCYISPETGFEACTGPTGNWFACSDRTSMRQTTEPELASLDANSVKQATKSKIAAKTAKPLSVRSGDKTRLAAATAKSTATQATSPTVAPPSESPDPVLAKAKNTVAAMLEDPASAEFGEMKRAMRTNTLGQSVDTICGHVKSKKASADGSGDRPFLYLVKDNEAYVVDGPATSVSATAYRNICN